MKPHSQFFRKSPDWFAVRTGSAGQNYPQDTASWLLESRSLTTRLRALCGDGFRVRLLRQDWSRPFHGESQGLQLRNGRRALVREVLLLCGDVPLVAARSVIPESALRGANRRLAGLGTRPLGEILFASPDLQRLNLELTRIAPGAWRQEARQRLDITEPVWGRRSLYSLRSGRLLVAEFFLPDLLCPSFKEARQ